MSTDLERGVGEVLIDELTLAGRISELGEEVSDFYRGRDLPPTVRRLGAGSFFQDVASEMVYPLLPGFLAALGGGAAVHTCVQQFFAKGFRGK